jgi:Tfp pilus assembly protein PilF
MPVNERALVIGNIGIFLLNQGRVESAIDKFKSALELNPYYQGMWAVLGWAYLQNRNFHHARSALQQAVALDPADPKALEYFGELHRHQGRSDLAIDYFSKALSRTLDTETKKRLAGKINSLTPNPGRRSD